MTGDWDRAITRVEENRLVKIAPLNDTESPNLSQSHRRPKEVECKTEPYFRLPLHTALYFNAPFDVIKALVGE